ncbi:MAG: Aspartate--tRNA ligase [Firmicutes bacterium ADurb.Bin248]|nr:MAG: Aspartate--tRNA ligase [Firmicutes bacterium ADurb.Bin248]HOG00116.1 aspartate--tRNA ligase [Clostridia bacterium]HPK17058.1 aspartate--tRNA ligase [Clostridia bacterium]
MSELLGGWKRTNRCAEVGASDVGKELLMMGWAGTWRNLGALIFIGLRDRSGVMQVVFDESTLPKEVFEAAETIRSEYAVAVKGILRRRAPEMVRRDMATGEFELEAKELKILSRAQTPPFYIDDNVNTQEQLRLKYRYLDLRRPRLQQIIMGRHRIAQIARNYYDAEGFLEIETPILSKSTPEGARDYLVPSRVHPGEFYALPQSPQQYKQLLMIAGFDRYFQIARCFRDEDLRADRQPEFTQIDVEMSFADEDDVMRVNEGFIARLLREYKGVEVKLPLRRMTWREAMDRYGSDKPDLRFGLELTDVSDAVRGSAFSAFEDALAGGGSVRAIRVPGGADKFARKRIDELAALAKTYRAKGLAWMSLKEEGLSCSFAKYLAPGQLDALLIKTGAQKGDAVFLVSDAKDAVVFASLGALRLELGRSLGLIDENRFELLWVTEFPLLEWDEEEQRFMAMHHPFTSPRDEDIDLLETDPGRVRAKAYDMVMNGNEIGGGSIRIHSAELQERMFKAIGFSREAAWDRFGYFMEAFKYGTPPHGGLAFGLDRIVMLLTGSISIREVIAFPKVQTAACLMTDAPGPVDQKQLDELHIGLARGE